MDSSKKIVRPLVSIILPCHNEAEWMEECVNSFINQTEKNIEIIIVDDGSSDESFNIAQKIKNKHNNHQMIVFKFEKNSGLGAARNKGAELSRGEYILQTDTDAVFPPDFIEKSLAWIKRNGADALSLGELRVHNRRNGALANYWRAKRKATFLLRSEGLREQIVGIYFYRRDVWCKVEGYEEKIPHSEDFDFGMKAQKAGIKKEWAKDVYFYHADPNNWKVFFMRLFNAARFSAPIQKKWGRWLTHKQKNKELLQALASFLFIALGLVGFVKPIFFLSWVLLFFFLGILPIFFHRETRLIAKICIKGKFFLTLLLLPLITFLRVIANNFGKVFAILFYERTKGAVTFDV